jgi:hypothetical protein
MSIKFLAKTVMPTLVALTVSMGPLAGHAEPTATEAKSAVAVDFDKSQGPRVKAERMNNLTRAYRYQEQRDADVEFFNEHGLHGDIYRVWIDAHRIRDPKSSGSGTYDYGAIPDYLADVSRLSDHILMVMDTRVEVRDHGYTPAQIKPVIKKIMFDLKKQFPQIKYIEAFNEPDHNLGKVLKPEELYDYYRVYYEAVNEINRELDPEVPLQLGGPAFMQYNEPWMRAFLDSYKADNSADKRLDFISWHAYGEFPEGDGSREGPRAYHFYKGDPSEVANQREKLEAELRSRGLDEDIPAFITELGIYPGPSFDHQNDPKPDYLIGAAGVPSLLYWFMEQDKVVPFNWVMRHGSEERKDQLVTRAGEGNPIPTGIFTPYGNALAMMAKLKDERVQAESDTLENGKGVYSIASRDDSGAAVMLWNYQHTGNQSYDVTVDLNNLPAVLRDQKVSQRMFRIDAETSNYWANPENANLQQVSEQVIEPGRQLTVPVKLSPNALHLIVLEPAK